MRAAASVPVDAVAVDPARGLLVGGGADGTVRTWRAGGAPGPVSRGHNGPVRAVAITPDGARVFSGGAVGTVRAWADDGTLRETLTGHADAVTALALAPDGSWFASTSHDAAVRIRDSRPPYTCLAMMRVSDRLNACAIRADGSSLVAAGRAGVYAFQLDGIRRVNRLHPTWPPPDRWTPTPPAASPRRAGAAHVAGGPTADPPGPWRTLRL